MNLVTTGKNSCRRPARIVDVDQQTLPVDLRPTKRLGAGIEGEVWLYEDELRRSLAVKFFAEDEEKALRDLVLLRARGLAGVQHPAVVSLIGVERLPHPETNRMVPALVMEHVPDVPLSLRIAPLTRLEAQQALEAAAAGVIALHKAGLIHGDLHEGNLVVVPGGAKLLDILYTRSLREIGTRTGQTDRDQDLRDLAVVFSTLLKKTEGVRSDAIDDAYREAVASLDASGILARFRRVLAHADAADVASDLVLVVLRDDSGVRTAVFAEADGATRRIVTVRGLLHATPNRVWMSSDRKRSVLTVSEASANREFDDLSEDADYEVTTIQDDHLHSLGEDVSIPLGTSSPAALERVSASMVSRNIALRGALGRFVFIEQHDWQLPWRAAHGWGTAAMRVLDLDAVQFYDAPFFGLFDELEPDVVLSKYQDIAQTIFAALRENVWNSRPELVSARPAFALERNEFDIFLKFVVACCYAATDGGWSSYVLTEEIPFRSWPVRLGARVLPTSLRIEPEFYSAVGWSRVAKDHPKRAALSEFLSRPGAGASATEGPQRE